MRVLVLAIAMLVASCDDSAPACEPPYRLCSDNTCVTGCCSDERRCGRDIEGGSVCASGSNVCCSNDGLGYACPPGDTCGSGANVCVAPR